ncbi:unnamed protein product [Gongylonema pulchrum]|uniref:MSP domain-containing protein n=1 Tax=Gongylonema pulchrum TaxID=637853 RepID=A0A183DRC1_9BILA|nr:unnamed protein product [Gongylonema pulchrum]
MSYPKELIFPATRKQVTRRLILRNNSKTDFAVKIRTNTTAITVEPPQGFLRAGRTQSAYVHLDGMQSARGQTVKVYCRPVSQKTEADCRRWFVEPNGDYEDAENQLAQVLRVKTSKGFTALEIRTNTTAITVEPPQGFLRAGRTQSAYVHLDGMQSARGQTVKVYCRPVSQKTEADCRRWFVEPNGDYEDAENQLAQVLRVKTSKGFTALEVCLRPVHLNNGYG